MGKPLNLPVVVGEALPPRSGPVASTVGDVTCVLSITEAFAGSDVAGLRTTAVLDSTGERLGFGKRDWLKQWWMDSYCSIVWIHVVLPVILLIDNDSRLNQWWMVSTIEPLMVNNDNNTRGIMGFKLLYATIVWTND